MASPGGDSGYEDGDAATLRGADGYGYDDADGFDNGEYGAASYRGGGGNYGNYGHPDAYGEDEYGEDDRLGYAPATAGGHARYANT